MILKSYFFHDLTEEVNLLFEHMEVGSFESFDGFPTHGLLLPPLALLLIQSRGVGGECPLLGVP